MDNKGLSLPPPAAALARSSASSYTTNLSDSNITNVINTSVVPSAIDLSQIKVAPDKNAGQPAAFHCPACMKPLGTPQAYKYHTKNNVCLKRAERLQSKSIHEILDAKIGVGASLYDLSVHAQSDSSGVKPNRSPSLGSTATKTVTSSAVDTCAVSGSVSGSGRYNGKPQRITMDPNVLKGYNEHKRFYEIGEYYYPSLS